MYMQVWGKYLPIIKILMKRAATGDQKLDMNRIDFERVGSGRKAGYKFNIEFVKGRVDNMISSVPMASQLANVLLQDETTKQLLMKNDFHISMNTKFQLGIKYFPVPIDPLEDESLLVNDGVGT
ncbi:MAG TPA: hypothetical protein PLA68_18325 [Panacibacter sp.]|nr:hypothetical protein [Panacibacter sp.]